MSKTLIDEVIFPKKSIAKDTRLALAHETVRLAYQADAFAVQVMGRNSDYLVRQYYQLLLLEDVPGIEEPNKVVDYLVGNVSIHATEPLENGAMCWAYLLPDMWKVMGFNDKDPMQPHKTMLINLLGVIYNTSVEKMIAPIVSEAEEYRYEMRAKQLEDIIKSHS